MDGGVIGYRLEQNQEGAIEDIRGQAEQSNPSDMTHSCSTVNGDCDHVHERREAKSECAPTNNDLSTSIVSVVEKKSEATNTNDVMAVSNSNEQSTAEADEFWVGKIFVFDDRLAVPLHERSNEPVISKCHSCGSM